MDYFAYGSNINLLQLATLLAEHGVDPDEIGHPRRAVLPHHRLRTNYYSSAHCAGACNVEPDEDHHVEGIVMAVTDSVHHCLRGKEGYPLCYEEVDVEVATSTGVVPSFIYMVTSARQLTIDLPVTPAYRRTILDGARQFRFSQSYLRQLRSLLRTIPTGVFVAE